MSLQTRLAPLITAIGADIKALQAGGGGGGSGTKVTALPETTAPDDDDQFYIIRDGVSERISLATLRTEIARGAKVVTATQSNSTITPTAITELTQSLVPGTYLIKMWTLWSAAAAGTGVGIYLNGSGGTVTQNAGHFYTTTTGTTATTGIADQATAAASYQMIESRAWRANNTNPGAFNGVDTAGGVQFAIMEAVVIVTATTSMQVMFVSDTAASAVNILAGTTLEVRKVT